MESVRPRKICLNIVFKYTIRFTLCYLSFGFCHCLKISYLLISQYSTNYHGPVLVTQTKPTTGSNYEFLQYVIITSLSSCICIIIVHVHPVTHRYFTFTFLVPSLCSLAMFKTLNSVFNTCHFIKSLNTTCFGLNWPFLRC
jgi:hypothetical protein